MRIQREYGDGYRQCTLTALGKSDRRSHASRLVRMEYGRLVKVRRYTMVRSRHLFKFWLRTSKGIWV